MANPKLRVAVNGRSDSAMHAHLLKYDSDYGRFPAEIESGADSLTIGGREVRVFQQDDPSQIDWTSVNVDVAGVVGGGGSGGTGVLGGV